MNREEMTAEFTEDMQRGAPDLAQSVDCDLDLDK